jgi:hypothetical protein
MDMCTTSVEKDVVTTIRHLSRNAHEQVNDDIKPVHNGQRFPEVTSKTTRTLSTRS